MKRLLLSFFVLFAMKQSAYAQVPANDKPCNPQELILNTPTTGTTCNATGYMDINMDGSPADWENVNCNNLTAEASVWYAYTPSSSSEGYELIVDTISIQNQMTVEVYGLDSIQQCSDTLTYSHFLKGTCATLHDTLRIPNCISSQVYLIKITTREQDCGEFQILISETTSNCSSADNCIDAITLITATPNDCGDGEIFFSELGCFDLACPESFYLDCANATGPTVWYKIEIDSDDANGLITQVDAPFDVIWNVYQGTTCEDMSPVSDPDGATAYPCSDSDSTFNNNHIVPISNNPNGGIFNYWVAITAVGPIGDDPTFSLNYAATLGCISCSGDKAFDCDNGLIEAFVDIDGFRTLSDGPFCPGQEVEVCITFSYDASNTGNDWLHGFVPDFGRGWDLSNTELKDIGQFEYFDHDGPCAPYINGYNLPNVCTYTDEDGRLRWCNTACDPTCPCEGPLEDGSPIPGGWFYNSPGGSPSCGLNCSPASFFGVGTNQEVTISDACFSLVVKTFDVGECNPEDYSLQVNIQTFSDAITGCWEDASPCIIDPSIQGPMWEIACGDNDPLPSVTSDTICSGEFTDFTVAFSDGRNDSILIYFENIDSIEGIGSDPQWNNDSFLIFDQGAGTVEDQLINKSNTIRRVTYFSKGKNLSYPCPP